MAFVFPFQTVYSPFHWAFSTFIPVLVRHGVGGYDIHGCEWIMALNSLIGE